MYFADTQINQMFLIVLTSESGKEVYSLSVKREPPLFMRKKSAMTRVMMW